MEQEPVDLHDVFLKLFDAGVNYSATHHPMTSKPQYLVLRTVIDSLGDLKLYASPTIPPEVAELQRENAELRKLLENKVPEEWQNNCIRQYMHNDGSGNVAAYHKDCIDSLIASLAQPNEQIPAETNIDQATRLNG